MITNYINLDSALQRRTSIETSFSQTSLLSGWTLSRFPAVSADDERVKKTVGSCTDSEKACFLSHATLVAQAAQSADYHWIVEDDARFWPESFSAVNHFLDNSQNTDWDILFTDTVIRSFGSMVDLYAARSKLTDTQVEYINLGTCPFSSAVSYIINPRSASKVAAVLVEQHAVDMPWDIHLAHAVGAGKLNAFFTLPFVTSFAPCAQQSQIRDMTLDVGVVLARAFRSLMCIYPDVKLAQQQLALIDENFTDEEAACFGKIIGYFMSNRFPKV